jgi:hypothetical protein
MEPSERPEEWTPAPDPEPDIKQQTHGPMLGFRYFERAGGDNGSPADMDS